MDVFTPNEVGEQWHPSNSFSHINPIIYHLPSCDLFQDTGDLPHSEGEFHPAVLTKRSTMRGVMEQLEQINSWSVQRLDHPVIQAPRVNVSLGEVNLHQRLASVSHPDQPYFNPQSTPAISHTNNGRLSRGAHEQQSLGKALLWLFVIHMSLKNREAIVHFRLKTVCLPLPGNDSLRNEA